MKKMLWSLLVIGAGCLGSVEAAERKALVQRTEVVKSSPIPTTSISVTATNLTLHGPQDGISLFGTFTIKNIDTGEINNQYSYVSYRRGAGTTNIPLQAGRYQVSACVGDDFRNLCVGPTLCSINVIVPDLPTGGPHVPMVVWQERTGEYGCDFGLSSAF